MYKEWENVLIIGPQDFVDEHKKNLSNLFYEYNVVGVRTLKQAEEVLINHDIDIVYSHFICTEERLHRCLRHISEENRFQPTIIDC